MKVRFIEGKRYDSPTVIRFAGDITRFYIKVTKRTSRYLHVDFYSERSYTKTWSVKDFKREKIGSYMVPVSQFAGHDPEYFFFVENNERIWFEADAAH